jgi:two-component system, OmpR family, sensor histidine kinase ChvG
MSLRLKLLLLGLATLVLPWAGCRYAREMESALRDGEVDSLQGVSQTIAASLQGRTDLLYRQSPPRVPAESAEAAVDAPAPDRVAERPTDPDDFRRGPYDLEPLTLAAAPLLDGYAADWPHEPAAWQSFEQDAAHQFSILTGVHERMLYVLLDVRDQHPLFDAAGNNPLDPRSFGDRVWLGFEDPQGEQQRVLLAASGPGPVTARRIVMGEYGEQSVVLEPRIRGAWQAGGAGYRVEVRVPLSMVGSAFGVLVDDRDVRGGTPVSYGTLRSDDLHTMGHLILASPDLTGYLAQFLQPGLKLAVTTPAGRLLARADALGQSATLGSGPPLLARLYRRFVDRPGERQVISSRAPIYDRDHKVVIGDLEVTQTADRWIRLRDRALTRMLNLTLVTSVVVVTAMFAFAAWLALRLSRLRRASESALTRSGLVTKFPETGARDELGDVARSFATLLSRLDEYTQYLRTLAGKLAHEIRTPLTIVRSSLDNLDSEQVPPAARAYLDRARQGSERLGAIVLAMGAATRVEESIGNAERVRFDVVAVLGAAVAAYRAAFPGRSFQFESAAEVLSLTGAPDLIVQMLDKLIDNAVDFSPHGSVVTVRLREEAAAAVIEVDNLGPALPLHLQGRVFESLWQSRPGSDGQPHLGLGLYIVRLIAEFHGGEASAANLDDGSGVRLAVRLPR